MVEPNYKAAGCGGCCVLAALWLILACFQGLHATKFALAKSKFTGVVHFDSVYHGGRNMIGFWNTYLEFPATVQSLEWIEGRPNEPTTRDLSPLQVRSHDGLNIRLGLIAKYFINKEKVADIYRTYKLGIDTFFISNMRSSILEAVSQFSAIQLYTNRVEVKNALLDACKAVCANVLHGYLTCWRIEVLEVYLSDKVNNANIRRQVEDQRHATEKMNRNASLIRSGTSVIESEFDRQIEVVHAKAHAKGFSLTSAAKANATKLLQEARAKALGVIQASVVAGPTQLSQEQLESYLEKTALIQSSPANLVYGDFGSAAVFDEL